VARAGSERTGGQERRKERGKGGVKGEGVESSDPAVFLLSLGGTDTAECTSLASIVRQSAITRGHTAGAQDRAPCPATADAKNPLKGPG
jgi:hypothetical protein